MTHSAQNNRLVVGTRGSLLARDQTQWVVNRIVQANPGLEVHTEIISTKGDRLVDKPLPEIGGKGLFTEELENALHDGSIDLAVHSCKDLPTDLAEGLAVLAYPQREDPRDAWISGDGSAFDDLPPNSVVGTTSLRRQAQLLMRRPDLKFVGLRGNVDTRIKKIKRGDCAGAVLALAGLRRCGLAGEMTHPFEPEVMLPAPAQGALALEGRLGDERVMNFLQKVHHRPTAAAVRCERTILKMLDAGCRAPVAVLAECKGDELHCRALVCDPEGNRQVRAEAGGPLVQADAIVVQIMTELREGGAAAIVADCRQDY